MKGRKRKINVDDDSSDYSFEDFEIHDPGYEKSSSSSNKQSETGEDQKPITLNFKLALKQKSAIESDKALKEMNMLKKPTVLEN